MPIGTVGYNGAAIQIDYMQHLIDIGSLGYMNVEFTSVSATDGCYVYADISHGTHVQYMADYFSSSGGILRAYKSPVVSAFGTQVPLVAYHGAKIIKTKSKFYYAPTVVDVGTKFKTVGISGGTSVGGNSSAGGFNQRFKQIISEGKYLLHLKPLADASTVIFDISLFEEEHCT